MCNDYVVDCNDLRLPYNSREFLKKLKNVWGVNLYLSQNRFSYGKDNNFSSFLRMGIRDGFIRHTDIYNKNAEGLMRHLRFIDLYPKSFMIGLDVQTVHYKNYYNKGHKEFTDVQSGKTPFYFVCLKKAVFPISIACNKTELWTRWHNELDNMMNCMFVQYGIGAKTALGYGCGFLVHAY